MLELLVDSVIVFTASASILYGCTCAVMGVCNG